MRNKMLVALALFYSFFISMAYANTTDTIQSTERNQNELPIAYCIANADPFGYCEPPR